MPEHKSLSRRASTRAALRRVRALGLALGFALVSLLPATATPAGAKRPDADATFTLSPSPVAISGCGTVTVQILINDAVDAYGADVILSFDPAVLEVVDYASGQAVQNGGFLVPPLFVVRNVADNVAGTVRYAATQLHPTPPASGSGVLAIVRFRAKSAGTSTLTFTQTDLADLNGNMLPATGVPGGATTAGPSAPVAAISRLNATTARLSWPAVSGVAEYHLYRDTAPYFTPAGTPYQTLTGLSYDDVGALGDVALNYFYVVRAACSTGLESVNSNRVGEFDFALEAGTGAGNRYTMIALPLEVLAQLPDADSLADYIGASVQQVLHWDAASQTYEIWLPPFGFGTNFALETSRAYWLELDSTAPAVVTFAGGVPAAGSTHFALLGATPVCLFNDISLPLDRPDLTSASELSTDVGGVEQALRWDAPSQTFDLWLPDFGFGTDFSTRIGYPYRLCLKDTAPSVWP